MASINTSEIEAELASIQSLLNAKVANAFADLVAQVNFLKERLLKTTEENTLLKTKLEKYEKPDKEPTAD